MLAENPPDGSPGTPPDDAPENPAPLVSIGFPIYNGAAHLPDVIDRILSQSHSDFELILCDNASTDNTREICLGYAAQDPRVRYHRQPENIGPARNFAYVMRLARGKYFSWVAHDDQWLAGHLASLVARLDADPGVALASNGWEGLDPDGNVIDIRIPEPCITSPDRREAFRRFLMAPYFEISKAQLLYGLFRHEVLASLPVEEIFGDMNSTDMDRPIGRDNLLLLVLLTHGRLDYSPSPATWRYRYRNPRKYRSLLKKTYDLLRFPLEGLLGRRKIAWRNIRVHHRAVDTIITNAFGKDGGLRAANLFNTIRLCALFK